MASGWSVQEAVHDAKSTLQPVRNLVINKKNFLNLSEDLESVLTDRVKSI